MNRRLYRRWTMAVAAPVVCAILMAGGLGVGQENGQPPAETAAKMVRGRLPAYFSALVTSDQRQQIYGIQADYQAQIEALQKKITELMAERDKRVDGVLTPAQLDEVNKKRAEASAKRKARSAQANAQDGSSG